MPRIFKLTYAKKYFESFMFNYLFCFRERLKNFIYQSIYVYLDTNRYTHTTNIDLYVEYICICSKNTFTYINCI